MERQRQRRLLAELRFGPGRQRSLPDQCRRVVRELERQLAKNSRLSNFTIVAARPPGSKLDRLVLRTMAVESPKAQISGDKAAISSQRVEDNAFHLHPNQFNAAQMPLKFAWA